MKRLSLVAACAALLGMSVASEATVVVFKGTATRFKALGNSAPTKVSTTVFFVVDFDQSVNQNYFVFASAAKKTYSSFGPRAFGTITVATFPAVTDFLISDAANQTSSHYVRFQGAAASLQLVAGNATQVSFPRALTGTYCDIDGNGNNLVLFSIPSITLTFDKVRTQKANAVNNPTAAGTAAMIETEYHKPGWTVGS